MKRSIKENMKAGRATRTAWPGERAGLSGTVRQEFNKVKTKESLQGEVRRQQTKVQADGWQAPWPKAGR